MQKNIFQTDTGGWQVAFRFEGESRWTVAYLGGSESAARRAYRKLG